MEHAWSEEQARWVFRRTATLRARGAKPVNGVVLPTREFFPDTLDASPKTVKRFFARTLELAGLDFLDVKVEIVSDGGEEKAGGCGTGGCSAPGLPVHGAGGGPKSMKRLEERGEGAFTARIATGELGHPTVLATVMVRTVAAMFLTELDGLATFAPTERETAVDLAATLLGFGPIVMNGSAIEVKGCGGMKVHAATALGPGEAALALSLACALDGIETAQVAPHLGSVALATFADAARFVGANIDTVKLVDASPTSVEDGYFKLKESGGLLSRTFTKLFGSKEARELADLEREVERAKSRQANPRDAAKQARLREIQELVEETLRPDAASGG